MLTLVLGGARSGKSSFAEKIAYFRGQDDVIYIATAEVRDEEMAQRVAAHKDSRPQQWTTIEEPVKVSQTLEKIEKNQVVLLDCITVLISNLFMKYEKNSSDEKEKEVLREMEQIVNVARKNEISLIMVSNEVGLGVVPAYKMGREYRDIAGRVNQFLSQKVDEVYFTIAGLPLEIQQVGLKNLKKFATKKDVIADAEF